ncbi:MAG: hemolysin family protein [Bacteroidetes bacterium]|nr:hemolysin family protein [Bacteroidota bacterium]MBU1422023.1 hemolysin family protein [Bacteroidota bacterium]MBU2471964.1 hemolysin family protein [Bacteroidota bacterium]MBU2636451.1 hemolysin family protein [Bacteroidota bacterium]
MITDIIFLIILLVLSALYAGSEIVFVVANKLKLEVKAKRKYLLAEQSLALISNPQKYFTISLVGNNVVNVAYSSLAALIFTYLFNLDSFVILAITASTVLVFGEIIPKNFFRDNADAYVPFFTVFLLISQVFLFPFIFITTKIFKIFASIFKLSLEPEKYSYSKEDIFHIIKEGEQAGMLQDDSASYLTKTIGLKDVPIREVMIPRIELAGIWKNAPLEKIYQKFIETNYSRIVVYDENIDNIVGVIYAKDLFKKIDNVESIIKEIFYVPESKSCTELLQQFFIMEQSIAVVVDEFGGTAGIVTVEDILEEIIGEIEEPGETEQLLQQKVDESTYLFSGRLEIDVINETFDIKIPTGSYVTLSGYVCEKIGRVPKTSEVVEIDDYTITILKATRTKIDKLKLEIKPPSAEF